jgi:CubicO group peptidase (beta-lactamase class C family)
MSEGRLREHLETLVEEGIFSSVASIVWSRSGVLWEAAAGEAQAGVPATPRTLFDYASITKPFVASLALVLSARGDLPLDGAIGDFWSEAHPDLAGRPLADLLRHRSGLAGWTPLYTRCSSSEEALSLLVRGGEGGDLLGAAAGTYSDLSFLLWAATAEKVCGESLADLLRSSVLVPLGLPEVVPAPGARPDLARSYMGTGKEVELAREQGRETDDLGPPPLGLPQDGNGRFLLAHGFGGGLTPHVGLFGRARDLLTFALEWLEPRRLLQPEAVRDAVSPADALGFHLGWWRHSLREGGGPALSSASYGHTGFAGGNLWVDPRSPQGGSVYVLLGSRIDPSLDVNPWRREFHTFAAGLLRAV